MSKVISFGKSLRKLNRLSSEQETRSTQYLGSNENV